MVLVIDCFNMRMFEDPQIKGLLMCSPPLDIDDVPVSKVAVL